jgi:ubiquinone biosynthesis accessory factor UbiK
LFAQQNRAGSANLSGEPPVEIPKVEDLLRSLMQGLPPGLASSASGLREDLENNFRAVLRANLGKLELAGREEFDAQRKVLERTRARLEELEKRVAALEGRSAGN